MSPLRRWLWKSARTVHLYVTLFGLALLVFFAITGFMLNHEHWFIDPLKEPRVRKGPIAPELLNPVNRLALENLLRRDFEVTGPLEPLEPDDDPLQFRFLKPGRRVEARVLRADELPPTDAPEDAAAVDDGEKPGEITVTYYDDGTAGMLVDLHKGKATGRVWKLLIDAVCIIVVVVSITGLILWFSLRGRGRYSALTFALGTSLGFIIYMFFVPR